MDINALLSSLAVLGLLIYTFKKWAIKGDFFHPGFIYSLINGGFFIVFTFGPYQYKQKIDSLYYYVYVAILYTFIIGIACGVARGRKQLVKDIKLKSTHLLAIYWLVVIVSFLTVMPLILGQVSLEDTVNNRFDALAARDPGDSNPVRFIIGTLTATFLDIGNAVTVATTVWKRRKYERLIVLLLLAIGIGIIRNSRTSLLFRLTLILVPTYTILKYRGIIDLAKIKKLSKSLVFAVPALAIVIGMIFFLTNLRSLARADSFENSIQSIERIYSAEQKPVFVNIKKVLPDLLVNPISQFSLYAGGTVAFGGVATDIAFNSNLKTWGTRTLNPIHRIIDRARLDGNFVEWARQNYFEIVEKGPPGFGFSWWGDPANFIVDYGLFGATIASAAIGWIIGWMYGRISNSGPILKSASTAILLNSMILTPAVGPFSFYPSFFSLSLLGCYLLKKSYKIKKTTIVNYPNKSILTINKKTEL